jgi:uncharacterized protein YlxP (DUF503 family)
MFVGVARFVLHIPGARTLKDRRQVVRSLKDRLRARLPVSVAEVGETDRLQVATLGVATVSGASSRCREVLDASRAMAGSVADALLADAAAEVVPFGPSGAGVRGGLGNPADDLDLGDDAITEDRLDDEDDRVGPWSRRER